MGKTAFIDIKPNRAYLPLLKLYQNGQEAFIEKILSEMNFIAQILITHAI